MKTSALTAALAVLLIVPAAEAQQLDLQIQDGRVSLDARNVPVRQILAEWARVGGARIVNGDKVAGTPVTLHLVGVPERQAIDTVLRGVSGYMLAPRPAATAGVSAFDRILILPTSAAPRNAPTANAGFPAQRPMPVQAEPTDPVDTQVFEDDGDNDEPEPDPEGGAEVVPQPGNRRFQGPTNFPMVPAQGNPYTPPTNYPGAPPPGDGSDDVPQGEPPSAANPFGIPAGASSMPGVIAPVPQQDPPGQPPRPRPRPPL